MEATTVMLGETAMAVSALGTESDDAVTLVFAHGWGHTQAMFLPLAEMFARTNRVYVLDLPGFGASALPPQTWGTADYADAIAEWLERLPHRHIVWVGHSFGGRIGLQLAARHPDRANALVLLAAAGLRPQRGFWRTARIKTRIWAFKLAKLFVPEGPGRDRLRRRFGSADAVSAGAMRQIFTRVVNEDLAPQAAQVGVPTLLLYGQGDTETPPSMGERLNTLIPGSELHVLKGFDHISVLTDGRHQVASDMRRFLGTLP